MKIRLNKIGMLPVTINRYISDELFSFTLEMPLNFYKSRLSEFEMRLVSPESNTEKFLQKKIDGSWLPSETTFRDIMAMNFNHVFKASEYITNGQKIATIVENEQGYEIAIHNDMRIFEDYFLPRPGFAQYSIASLGIDTFDVYEKAISEIVKHLSKIEIVKIPTNHGAQSQFLEIRRTHPMGYIFKINENEIFKEIDLVDSLDKITIKVAEWVKPITLQCCLMCSNFEFRGLAYEMSGGEAGYCNYIRKKTTNNETRQSIMHIWNLCEKYEEVKD
jgi:hypothetical protein